MPYRLLYAFGFSEADLRRFRERKGVVKTFEGLLIKGLFCYRESQAVNLTNDLEQLKADEKIAKASPKIIAVSDGQTIVAYDMREKETYENSISKLYYDYNFFYPLMGVEKVVVYDETRLI